MPNSPICPAQWMLVLRRRWRWRRRRFILRRRRLLVSPRIHNDGRRGCGHEVLLVCTGLACRAFRRDRAVVWKCDRGRRQAGRIRHAPIIIVYKPGLIIVQRRITACIIVPVIVVTVDLPVGLVKRVCARPCHQCTRQRNNESGLKKNQMPAV